MNTSATMYLAAERGVDEDVHFRRFSTLSFGKYLNHCKMAVDKLFAINDTWIAGDKSVNLVASKKSTLVLIPVAGAIEVLMKVETTKVAAGQVFSTVLNRGEQINVQNLFVNDAVNVMELWFEENEKAEPGSILSTADVSDKNILNRLQILSDHFSVSLGSFTGRGEVQFDCSSNTNSVYLFVLNGVFEVNGRLIHNRDGLALYNEKTIEMEALSNDAIILMIEQ